MGRSSAVHYTSARSEGPHEEIAVSRRRAGAAFRRPDTCAAFTPGYVDPAPLLEAAASEIGEADLNCITFSGTGYGGAVGQTFENAVNIDWPRIDSLANYARTINWEEGTSKETFDRKPGLNPASWKYGLGWQGGTPTQRALRQTHIVNGRSAWHIDGDGPPVAVPPELAELYQLDLWLNPHGFLKAARLPGANPVAFWRWEQLEKGRDGNVVPPEKVHVVAITMLGKHRVDATINSRNQITRIKTTVNEPALGDFNIEHESTESDDVGQREVADRVAFAPRLGRQLAVLPPEHRPQRLRRQVRQRPAERVRRSRSGAAVSGEGELEPPPVTVEKMADGVYLIGGGPANSYMVEFRDFVAVFEAPKNEERSLAVIEAIAKLAPGKPIRWLISSHPHFDHIGGLRTYLHIGATIVAHMKNLAFLNRDVLNYEPRTVKPDIVVEVAADRGVGGLQLRDGPGELRHHRQPRDPSRLYVQPLRHVEGMLMAYLPAERIVFQADLFDTHEPPRAAQLPSMRSLANQVARMKLDVDDAGAGARQAGTVEHVPSGAEVARGIGPVA